MDKTEQKTEDKQVVAESLEDATMSVLNEMWPFDKETRRTIKDTVAAREADVANVEKYLEQIKQLIARFPDIKTEYSEEEAKKYGVNILDDTIRAGTLVEILFESPWRGGAAVNRIFKAVIELKKLNFNSDDLLSVAKQLPYFFDDVEELADIVKSNPRDYYTNDVIKQAQDAARNTARKYFRDVILNIINLIPEYNELRYKISDNVRSANERHLRLGAIQPRKLVNKYYTGYGDESKAEAVIRNKNGSISNSLRQIVRKMNDPELAKEAKGEIDEFIGKINNILARDGQGYRLK